jgi:CRP/FNR family cyclic AMP-dependent transcriptional regulator
VKALSDCELIEIPIGTLDTVLFSKPAWARALMMTLSKRLKRSNENP